jgi:transcriptional regulator with XRE-family HTH domain
MHPQALTLRKKKLGVLIYDARLAKRRTLEECAKAIGVAPGVFRSFEMGDASPSLPQVEILAFFLGVPIDHFWGHESLTEKQPAELESARLVALRQRMIGAMLHQARTNANLTEQDVANKTGISLDDLHSIELGEKSVALPLLEALAGSLGGQVEEFFDASGPVGVWRKEQIAMEKFHDLPAGLQEFVCKPVNRPYVELALRLSELSVERLRAIAEGLLEITY